MSNVSLFLKILALIIFIVSLMHLLLGPDSEVLLGANLPVSALSDSVLDSQNRFYGVAFALYGALFYLCSTDLKKYIVVLRFVLLFFFAGGLARVVSIYAVGLPSNFVVGLLVSELVLPVLILLWVRNSGSEI